MKKVIDKIKSNLFTIVGIVIIIYFATLTVLSIKNDVIAIKSLELRQYQDSVIFKQDSIYQVKSIEYKDSLINKIK